MIHSQKLTAIAAWVIMVSLGLSACSKSSNPLTSVSKHEAGVFLAKARNHAQKTLKWSPEQYGAGGAYGSCMKQKNSTPQCQKLYKAMLSYAKQTKAFRNLTLSQLTDEQMFKTVKEAYQGAAFDLLPY